MITALYLGIDSVTTEVNLEHIKKYGALSCTVLSDPEKALLYLKQTRTELVFVEHHALQLDAMQFYKLARHNDIFSEFIIITAESASSEISSMYLSGVFEVLAKPYDYNTFSMVVRNYEYYISRNTSKRVSEGGFFRNSVFAGEGSQLENEILRQLEAAEFSAGDLSKKLKQSDFLVNQCLNRLVSGGILTTTVKDINGTPRRVFSKKTGQ